MNPGSTFAVATLNTPPTAHAGGPGSLAVTIPSALALSGSATDDGVTVGPVTFAWTKASGPGTVAFGTPNAASTTATFSTPGTYVLMLTASDGELSGSDTVTVIVSGAVNHPPSVDAGPDQSITLPTNTVTVAASCPMMACPDLTRRSGPRSAVPDR